MDEIQSKLIDLLKMGPDCVRNRKVLKSTLMDILPENKLYVNLLMNAFDEGIVDQLDSSTDSALLALRMIKRLIDGYGLTKQAATWSIASWCFILNLSEVAELLNSTISTNDENVQDSILRTETTSYKKSFDLRATYRAGTDFPAGDIKIELDGKMQKGECSVSVSRSPKRLRDLEGTWFNSQVYVKVKEGDYLAVFPWNYIGWELDFSTYRISQV